MKEKSYVTNKTLLRAEPLFEIELDYSDVLSALHTTYITEEMAAESRTWATLKYMYESKDFVVRALASILNACITQKRIVICLSKRTIGKLLSKDSNLPNRNTTELKSSEYRRILHHLLRGKRPHFICASESKVETSGKSGQPNVLELIQKDLRKNILSLLGLSEDLALEKQYQEAEQFAIFTPIIVDYGAKANALIADFLQKRESAKDPTVLINFQRNLRKLVRQLAHEVPFYEWAAEQFTNQIDVTDKTVMANIEIELNKELAWQEAQETNSGDVSATCQSK